MTLPLNFSFSPILVTAAVKGTTLKGNRLASFHTYKLDLETFPFILVNVLETIEKCGISSYVVRVLRFPSYNPISLLALV